MKKACRDCKVLVSEGSTCPICKSSNLTTSWKGILLVYDTESVIAKEADISAPGEYAIRVSG